MLTRTQRTTTTEPDAGAADQRPTPTGSDRQEPRGLRGPASTPMRWVTVLVALAVLVAVAMQLGAVGEDPQPPDPPAVSEADAPDVGSQEFLARLAEQGYIPPEAVDQERLLLERLVEEGRIPAETLD
jgi:hypothetical protein